MSWPPTSMAGRIALGVFGVVSIGVSVYSLVTGRWTGIGRFGWIVLVVIPALLYGGRRRPPGPS